MSLGMKRNYGMFVIPFLKTVVVVVVVFIITPPPPVSLKRGIFLLFLLPQEFPLFHCSNSNISVIPVPLFHYQLVLLLV